MHDHFRDLGRKIAEEGSMPLRLWRFSCTRNIYDSIEESVRDEVRGITMVPRLSFEQRHDKHSFFYSEMSWYERWRHEVFLSRKCQMRNLQFVTAEDGYLKGILSRLPSPHLVWLCCPYYSLPSWIRMENLKVLDLAGDRLNMLWRHESQAPLQLRELNVCAPLLHFPKSIKQLEHLEMIVVDGGGFETLPEDFSRLRSLKYLHLRQCTRMKSLPDSFGNLTNLQHIQLSEAHSLEMLPNSFGGLKNLKKLVLERCEKLKCLHDSVGLMTQLTVLTLSYVGIQSLPQDLEMMKNLDILEVECCRLRQLSKLDYLQISKIKISDWRGILKYNHCDDLMEVGPFPTTLMTLDLSWRALKKIAGGFFGLANLQHLDISCCFELEKLPSLETLISLEVMKAVGCHELKSIPDLSHLTKLRILNVGGCCKIAGLRGLKYLKSLEELRVWGCSKLEMLPGLEQLAKLRILDVHGCREIEELLGVQELMLLEELRASKCYKLKGIGDSMHGSVLLRKLRILDVHDCHEITKLPDVQQLMSLEKLDLFGCPKLQWESGTLRKLRQRLKEGLCESTPPRCQWASLMSLGAPNYSGRAEDSGRFFDG